jgi:predicted dehydrogenase
MLKIGFIDHHLNNFHANKFLALLHGPLAGLDARVVAAWESDPAGDDWCAKNGIRRAESAGAATGECDALMILAPDNIEAHLGLCRLVFSARKPCLVDKFLASNLHEAKEIVKLAEENGVRLFSASSLRFAVELEAALEDLEETPSEAFARGMGEWDLYGVHTLSLLVRVLGPFPVWLNNTGTDTAATVTLKYAEGRQGWIDVRTAANQWEVFPWTFGFQVGDRYVTGTVSDYDGFYSNLMRRAVHFFKTGESPVTTDEMLGIVAILEKANRSRERDGEWMEVW